jgi:hypothetical protein
MGIRLVRSAGSVHEPAVVNLPASGIIHKDGLVIWDTATNLASASLSGTGATTTNVIGVSLDGIQGASDAYVRVIPFVQGQLWEVDCANVAATTNLFFRHQMASDLVVRNITGASSSETFSTGIFLAYATTGLATGSGKLIGTFLQRVGVLGKDGVTPTT